MDYAFWADVTALTHFLIIVGVLIGLLVSFRYKRFRPWEAGILITIGVLWSYYGNCPLSILEQYFRELAGQSSNITSVGFIPYYANKLLGVSVQSKLIQQSTFYSSAVFFGASIEWFKPFFHKEITVFRRKAKRKIRKII